VFILCRNDNALLHPEDSYGAPWEGDVLSAHKAITNGTAVRKAPTFIMWQCQGHSDIVNWLEHSQRMQGHLLWIQGFRRKFN